MATRIDQIGYNDRQEIIEEISLRLADGMVDVELDRAHYDIAINKALQKYRQLSSGSVEEAVIFIQTTAGVVEYTLPDEVIDVKRLYRRGIGTNSGGGTNFDPFDVAFNNMYMLQAGQIGGLAVFDAFAQYKETIGRIFGSEYNFTFNRNSKQLTILRNVNHAEDIAVGVNNFIPEYNKFELDLEFNQNKVILRAENKNYSDIKINPSIDELVIEGSCVALLRESI